MAENIKKPAVTQAEIKKNAKANGERPKNQSVRKSAGAGNKAGQHQTNKTGQNKAGKSSTGAGNKTGQHQQPKNNTGTAKRSGQNQSNKTGAKVRTGQHPQGKAERNGRKSPQRNGRPEGGTRPGGRRPYSGKRGRRKISTTEFIVGSVVVGLFLAFVVTLIMRAFMLGVNETGQKYILGTTFTVSAYVTPKSENAKISYDKSQFNPEGPGEYEITVTVTSGRLSAEKKVTIDVVDDDTPVISGNDSISLLVGDEVNWADYYMVTDAQPDLAEQITAVPDIDTSEAGTYTTTLQVIDWAEHISTKEITVKIYELGEEMTQAVRVSRQYKSEYNLYPDSSGIYVYAASDDEDGAIAYVLVSSNTMYKVFSDGSCVYYETDSEDKEEVNASNQLYLEIKANGTLISYNAIVDFLG